MQLKFEKWHGCLNDFAVLWISDADGDVVLDSLKRQAVRLCDRRAGIGGDGLLVLTTKRPGELTPYRLTIINSDGSIAKNCGNGLRCAASSVLKAHREKGDPKNLPDAVEFDVEGASMVARFMKKGAAYPMVAVEMGVPTLGGHVTWEQDAQKAVTAAFAAANERVAASDIAVCEIGNPHIVVTTEHASRELMLAVGPALQKHAAWDGMNVHIVRPGVLTDKDQARAKAELGQGLSDLVTVYVYERGAGETMACGSGACAVGAAAMATGLVDRDAWYGVDMPGGRLYVKQSDEGEPVLLAGPATFVFNGTVEI